ncbi:MAG: hypothetical protein HN921_14550, partial [Bacteroidetes bacterium]|nr:hypothetical protein [Bacteroidota bacterium]
MSTVAVIFNEGKINKKGEVPIWLRIIKDRKSKYIALGVRVHKDNWDPDKCKVRKNHPNSQRLNNYIAKRVADAEGVALDLETNSRYSSPRKLKDAILGRTSESFIKYAEKNIQVLKNNEKIGTLAKYDSVLTKLKVYLKGQDLTFDEITVSFLKDYESYLKNKLSNSINTVHSNLKVLRKLVNDAVREEIFPLEKNPFLRFKLHTEKTKKNFLTDEELKVLEDLPLNTSLKSHHHRNMYVFAAYTGGLRISDVLQLKWENYDGERIILHTQKTDDTLSIIVPNKARVILD